MNQSIIKDTKHYYLNSNGGEIKNSYLKSDIIFNIPNLIKDEKHILYNTVSIVHCEIPYSFYIINEYNNLLSLSTGNIYIPYGNYNANSLITYLKTQLPANMNITLNSSNGVLSLIYNQQFQIYPTTTVYKVLGLQNKTYTSINNTIIFDYPCNFLGTKNLYIKSNIILDNFNSTTKDYITLSNIPVSVEPFSIVLYNNYSNSKHIIKNKNLDNIEIKIFDDDNNLIDFNNTDWSITLEIETYISANFDNINLIQYLNTGINN